VSLGLPLLDLERATGRPSFAPFGFLTIIYMYIYIYVYGLNMVK
jgi:hypothetical protein